MVVERSSDLLLERLEVLLAGAVPALVLGVLHVRLHALGHVVSVVAC